MKLPRFFAKRADINTRKPGDNPLRARIGNFLRASAGIQNCSTYITAQKCMQNPVVYLCVHKIAQAVQSVSWYAEIDPEAPDNIKRTISEKYLAGYNALLSQPCGFTGAQLRYWMAMKLALEGRVVLKVGILEGEPNGIYPLPDPVSTETDMYGNIYQYLFGTEIGGDPLPARDRVADSKRAKGRPGRSFAFEISRPHQDLSAGKSTSPLMALRYPVNIIDELLQRAYELSSGTPNLKHILWTPDKLDAQDNQALHNSISERQVGVDEGNGYLVLDGITLHHIAIDDGVDNLHTKVPSDDMARRIAGILEVPVALIGLTGADGAKFASNYIESRKSFFEDTIIPGYLIPLQESFTANICPPGIRVRYDLDSISALLQDRISAFAQVSKAGFLTDKEKRVLLGFPPDKEI